MSTGDRFCTICGNYWCQNPKCRIFEEVDRAMSVIPPREMPRRVPRFDFEDLPEDYERQQMIPTKDDLERYLCAYLNDPVFAARFADCIDMIKRKNADYTQGVEKRDRIAAFRRIGGDIGVPMEKVWAIFAQKHWGAVMKYVKDRQVESEPIGGRINDLINYFVLLGAIVDDIEANK
jgi:hypothetical protein